MSKSKPSRRPPRPLSLQQANERIDQLRQRRIPLAIDPEDLHRPIDPAVRLSQPDDRSTLLQLVIDGQAVSWLTVIDYRQQIGSQTLRMAGVAGVGTHDEHRFQGHSRRLITNALRWMRQAGFETSMLFGIPAYYPRFGYGPAFPTASFSMAVADAPSRPTPGCRVEDFNAAHLPAVLKMYHRNNAGRTGPVHRPRRHWRTFRKGLSHQTRAVAKVLIDRRSRCAGYIVFDEDHRATRVLEAGHTSLAVLGDLLAAAAGRADAQGAERLTFHLPADHALCEFCKPLGIRQELIYRPDGGAMIRMIHSAAALTALREELAGRLRRAACPPAKLTLRTNLDAAALHWTGEQLHITDQPAPGPQARLSQTLLAQLIYGYQSPAACLAAGTLQASRAAAELLEVLFPPRPHFFYATDEF